MMKKISGKYFLLLLSIPIITSCKSGDKEKQFTVKGTVKNSKVVQVFLEEVNPVSQMQIIVDSSSVAADGSFSLKTGFSNEKLYTLRVSNSLFAFATLINDASDITVNADLNNRENLYNVSGSVLSDTINYISVVYPKKWTKLMAIRREYDSLQNAKGADSLIKKIYHRGDSSFADIKNGVYSFLQRSPSPIFSWYLLRNFQHLFTVEEYSDELSKAEKKFPGNEYLAAARNRLNQQIADAIEKQKKENEKTNQTKPDNP